MVDEVYLYIGGLSLLAHGSISFSKQLKSYDKRSLHFFLAFGNISTFLFFIWGFFLFTWYAPLVATLLLPMAYQKVHNDFFRYNLFFALKDHLCIFFGFLISLYTITINYF